MAGVSEANVPVRLTNRFQPLSIMTNADVSFSQSRLTDQTKNTLKGKNETGQLEGESIKSSNITVTPQQSISSCVPKIAMFQQLGCTDQPLLAMQSKNKLAEKTKQNWDIGRGFSTSVQH